MNRFVVYNFVQDINDKIYESSLEDFIAFAKKYNIFQQTGTQFYKQTCDKIKDRLQKEGLSIDIIRPE